MRDELRYTLVTPNRGQAWRRRLVRWAMVATATLAPVSPGWAQKTYYIDESTDFTGNGCQNADLNDVTSSLRSSLNAGGWSGQRWTNSNAWPQDFMEQTISGLSGVDNLYGDNALLTVYAGHGNRGLLQFGFPRNNRCTITLQGEARLGTQAGNRAAYAMYVTSCTVNLDSLNRHFNNQIRQTFGYHNSPSVKDDQPRDFFEATNGKANARAWIDEMEDRPGWFTGDNSPIAMTFGLDSSHCQWVRDTARLRDGVLLSTAPEPHTWFCWRMYDHGGC